MSKQKIISGNVWNALHDTTTEYLRIDGGPSNWQDFPNIGEADTTFFAVAGTLKSLRLILLNAAGDPTAPPTGKTFVFTTRKNGSDTLQTATIGSGETEAQDLTNDVSIAAGDRLLIGCAPTGGAGPNRYAIFSYEFVPTVDGESVYFNAGGPWLRLEAAGYASLVGACSNPHVYALADVRQYVAAPGKIKDLRLFLSNNPGTGVEGWRLTLYLNGSPTALTITISGAGTSGSNTSDEITVATGDLVAWHITPLNSPTNSVNAGFGFAFDPDDNAESLFVGGWQSALNTGATAYHGLHSNTRAWDTAEKNVWQLAQHLATSTLYVEVSVAPGAGKSWVFTVMKNGCPTTVKVTISGTATTGSNLVDRVAFADDDYISMRAVPSGTPAAANARWGLVQVAGVVIQPYEALTRVTGIRHIYRPGMLRMQVMMGDVSNTIEIAEAAVRAELVQPEQPVPPIRLPSEEVARQEERRLEGELSRLRQSLEEGVIEPPPIFTPGGARRTEVGLLEQMSSEITPRAGRFEPKNLWQQLTPWREERGETFGSEVIERIRKSPIIRFFGGLFGGS